MKALLLRSGLVAVGGAAVIGATSAAPLVLRELPAFRATSVEVVGTRWLPPHEALRTSGIDARTNLFDDFEPWIARLEAHPLVAQASIDRRLPSTLVLRIREAVPIALARTPELQPVDARGRLLPVDPAGLVLDLPVLTVPSRPDSAGRLTDQASLTLLAAIADLAALEPALAGLVSEAAPASPDAVRLRLRSPATAELLVPRRPDARRLREVRLALGDLERRHELHRLRRMDARYRDQLTVALDTGAK